MIITIDLTPYFMIAGTYLTALVTVYGSLFIVRIVGKK